MKFHEISRKEARISWNYAVSVSSFQALHLLELLEPSDQLYMYTWLTGNEPKARPDSVILIDSAWFIRGKVRGHD